MLILCKSVTLQIKHINLCHTTVGPQCLSCWLNYLFWYLMKPNLSNELVQGQSSTDSVYCSGSLGWGIIECHIHLPHFGSSNGFHSLLPVVFTEAILDKERAWKKQITLPHTGLLYQCSMSTVLPVECINVRACVRACVCACVLCVCMYVCVCVVCVCVYSQYIASPCLSCVTCRNMMAFIWHEISTLKSPQQRHTEIETIQNTIISHNISRELRHTHSTHLPTHTPTVHTYPPTHPQITAIFIQK